MKSNGYETLVTISSVKFLCVKNIALYKRQMIESDLTGTYQLALPIILIPLAEH